MVMVFLKPLPCTIKKLHYWSAHYLRLKQGCERLGITPPKEVDLLDDLKKLSVTESSAVLKLVISRGEGGRGYSAMGVDKATVILSLNPWPDFVETYQRKGIDVRLCQHRLIINPALAGIKHLNRLDQVMARNEWHNDSIKEGLMLDQNDHIVEGVSTNIFIKINDSWLTPPTHTCAVAGIMRDAVLKKAEQTGINIEQRKIHHSELSSAKQMFVTNSIWGLVPVVACESYQFDTGDDYKHLQMDLEQDIESVSYDI